MKIKHLLLISFITAMTTTPLMAQFVHHQAESYEYPAEPEVMQRLEQWRDLKFGIIMHWGLYSVPGICESWPLCSEDESWIPRDSTMRYDDYKKWYWGLANEFKPTKFNPEKWAETAYNAGMKYVVFTTKHHDGFCMFDSKQTDFSVANFAFKDNEKKDIARYVFEAFRKKDLWIGAYFSKPDWHCQDYWWDYFATPNRHVNYTISNHPERWKRYQDYTYNQLFEIMNNYGDIDILWLDGGWVDKEDGEDVNMDRIAKMARIAQPDLLLVDRTVHGQYENYATPEQQIPEKQLNYPWESCITLSHAWGYAPNATFKTPQQVISNLAEITAKGGSLLLGIGPTPEGTFEKPVIEILDKIGKWLEKNGEAIYSTRTTPIYNDGQIWFTASKDAKTLYAIHTISERGMVPETITWKGNIPKKGSTMILLQNGKKVRWRTDGKTVTVSLPRNIDRDVPIALKFIAQ